MSYPTFLEDLDIPDPSLSIDFHGMDFEINTESSSQVDVSAEVPQPNSSDYLQPHALFSDLRNTQGSPLRQDAQECLICKWQIKRRETTITHISCR